MSPQEEAKSLLKEFDFRGKPLNDAGIFANEMIYEWQNNQSSIPASYCLVDLTTSKNSLIDTGIPFSVKPSRHIS